MTAAKHQWQGSTGGGTLGQRLLIMIFRRCNLRVGYCVAAVAAPFYMLFARKGYLAVYHYFRHQHGCSKWKSFIRTYRNHFLFGQVVLDKFAVFASMHKIFDVQIDGYEHFERLCNDSKGFVVVSSHVGNFEIAGYSLKAEKKPMTMLYYDGETKIVQHNRSRMLNRSNIRFIPAADDMSHLFAVNAALQNGEIVSMFADRMAGSGKYAECSFLNGKAKFPVGAFALAAGFEVEVLAVFCMKTAAKQYKIFVQPCSQPSHKHASKSEQIQHLAQNYAAALENIVRQYPLQWFNFYEFWKN
jgi:predicted LPLAT superfamily acyltransferase